MIFDTDVLIWASRGDASASALIRATPEREVSIISQMEMMQGARSRGEMTEIQSFLRDFHFAVIPVDPIISYAAAGLIEEHALSHGLQFGDALIGATARHIRSRLATGNVRHFRFIKGLDVKTFRPSGKGR